MLFILQILLADIKRINFKAPGCLIVFALLCCIATNKLSSRNEWREISCILVKLLLVLFRQTVKHFSKLLLSVKKSIACCETLSFAPVNIDLILYFNTNGPDRLSGTRVDLEVGHRLRKIMQSQTRF